MKSQNKVRPLWQLKPVFGQPWIKIPRLSAQVILNIRHTPFQLSIGILRNRVKLCVQSRVSKKSVRDAGTKITKNRRRSGNYGWVQLGEDFHSMESAAAMAEGLFLQFIQDNPEHMQMPTLRPNTPVIINYGQLTALLDTAGVKKNSADVMTRAFIPVQPKEDDTEGKSPLTVLLERVTSLLRSVKAQVDSVGISDTVTPKDALMLDDAFEVICMLAGITPIDLSEGGYCMADKRERLTAILFTHNLDARHGLFSLGYDPDQSSLLTSVEKMTEGEPDLTNTVIKSKSLSGYTPLPSGEWPADVEEFLRDSGFTKVGRDGRIGYSIKINTGGLYHNSTLFRLAKSGIITLQGENKVRAEGVKSKVEVSAFTDGFSSKMHVSSLASYLVLFVDTWVTTDVVVPW